MLLKQMSFKIVMLFSLVIRAMYGRVRQVLQLVIGLCVLPAAFMHHVYFSEI